MTKIHSVFKSFDETLSLLKQEDLRLELPAIKKLIYFAEAYSNKTFPIEDAYPNPFIVVEGLDGVGKYKN